MLNTLVLASSIMILSKSFSLDRVVCAPLYPGTLLMVSKFSSDRDTVPIAFPILCIAFCDLLAPKPSIAILAVPCVNRS